MKATVFFLAAIGLAAPPMLAQGQPGQMQPGPRADRMHNDADRPLSSGGVNTSRSEAGTGMRSPEPYSEHPMPITQNDVTFVCGGVGDQEQAYMKQEAKAYNMMLTFATRKGDYLADVDVAIRDAKGNDVLQANCDGPMMLIDLPKGGTYRVHAEAAGYSLNRTMRVSAPRQRSQRMASAVLTWPQQVAEGPRSETTSSGSSGGASNRASGIRERSNAWDTEGGRYHSGSGR